MCHKGVLRDGTARSCPRPLSSGNDVWGRSDLNRRPTDYEPATWRITEDGIVSFDPTKPRSGRVHGLH